VKTGVANLSTWKRSSQPLTAQLLRLRLLTGTQVFLSELELLNLCMLRALRARSSMSAIDDFDVDVGDAELNRRAWVLQESVLARRTVHFTAKQTYFECGEGVYCENLVKLEW
jgi:hypothetical protein